MKTFTLGNTGIEVTELCFGALPMGPSQKNLPAHESASIVALALKKGVRFIDTAQMYKTYEPIAMAIEQTGIVPVIATKSAANTYEEMDAAISEALSALKLPYIDIFLLHAARVSTNVFEERKGALLSLIDAKKKGLVKAIGISTHSVPVVSLAAKMSEIDIVFPIINKNGMGILNGNKSNMEDAINECFSANKGVYFMKALGGGNLIDDYKEAMGYVREFSNNRAPIALGMVTKEEVNMNVAYFNGENIDNDLAKTDVQKKEFIVLSGICKRCGKCIPACHSGAITLTENQAAKIDPNLCLTCGYCVAECKEFAIRMV